MEASLLLYAISSIWCFLAEKITYYIAWPAEFSCACYYCESSCKRRNLNLYCVSCCIYSRRYKQ